MAVLGQAVGMGHIWSHAEGQLRTRTRPAVWEGHLEHWLLAQAWLLAAGWFGGAVPALLWALGRELRSEISNQNGDWVEFWLNGNFKFWTRARTQAGVCKELDFGERSWWSRQREVIMKAAFTVIGRKLLGSDSGLPDRDAWSLFLLFCLGNYLLSFYHVSILPNLWLPPFTSPGNEFSALVHIIFFPFSSKNIFSTSYATDIVLRDKKLPSRALQSWKGLCEHLKLF